MGNKHACDITIFLTTRKEMIPWGEDMWSIRPHSVHQGRRRFVALYPAAGDDTFAQRNTNDLHSTSVAL